MEAIHREWRGQRSLFPVYLDVFLILLCLCRALLDVGIDLTQYRECGCSSVELDLTQALLGEDALAHLADDALDLELGALEQRCETLRGGLLLELLPPFVGQAICLCVLQLFEDRLELERGANGAICCEAVASAAAAACRGGRDHPLSPMMCAVFFAEWNHPPIPNGVPLAAE